MTKLFFYSILTLLHHPLIHNPRTRKVAERQMLKKCPGKL